METKIFELRDVGTFIPIICIEMSPDQSNASECYLLERNGFSAEMRYIQLVWTDYHKAEYDPFKWGDRTFYTAHRYIKENWDRLKSGDVIDVEFILGETDTPKVSEMFTEVWR